MAKFKIDSYKLNDKDKVVVRVGRDLLFKFHKHFEEVDKNLNLFKINKQSYYNVDNANHICQYINIFNKFYDDDKEYLNAMINLKYQIDSKSMAYGLDVFIYDVIEYLLSDSMIKKIWKLVNDNYSIDLEASDEPIKEDAQVLQFNNSHGRQVMALSVACKLTIPLVCHYHAKRGVELAKSYHARGDREISDKEYYYKIFCSYFPLFQGDCDLLNKLIATAMMQVSRTVRDDSGMWNRSRNRNLTPTIQIPKLMVSVVNDLLPKYLNNRVFISVMYIETW